MTAGTGVVCRKGHRAVTDAAVLARPDLGHGDRRRLGAAFQRKDGRMAIVTAQPLRVRRVLIGDM